MTEKLSRYCVEGEIVVCRCEGVTASEIRSAIDDFGLRTVNEVKKVTRAGMGPCQGHTCAMLIREILIADAKVPPNTEPYLSRPPVRGVLTRSLAADADHFEEPRTKINVWGHPERSVGT